MRLTELAEARAPSSFESRARSTSSTLAGSSHAAMVRVLRSTHFRIMATSGEASSRRRVLNANSRSAVRTSTGRKAVGWVRSRATVAAMSAFKSVIT